MKKKFELVTPDKETNVEIGWSLFASFVKKKQVRTLLTIPEKGKIS